MCKINSLILALLLLLFYSSSEINAQTEVGTFYSYNNLIHSDYKQKYYELQRTEFNDCNCIKAVDVENYYSNSIGTQVKFDILGIANVISISHTSSKFNLTHLDANRFPSRVLLNGTSIDVETAINHESFYEIQNVRIDINQEFKLFDNFYILTGMGTAATFKENYYLYSLEDFGKNYPIQFEQADGKKLLNNGRTQEIYRVSGSESNVNPIHIYANLGIGYNFDIYGVTVNPFIQANLMLNQFNKTTPWRVSMISSGIAFRYGI